MWSPGAKAPLVEGALMIPEEVGGEHGWKPHKSRARQANELPPFTPATRPDILGDI